MQKNEVLTKLSFINKWLGIPIGSFLQNSSFTLPLIDDLYKEAESSRDNDSDKFSILLKAINNIQSRIV